MTYIVRVDGHACAKCAELLLALGGAKAVVDSWPLCDVVIHRRWRREPSLVVVDEPMADLARCAELTFGEESFHRPPRRCATHGGNGEHFTLCPPTECERCDELEAEERSTTD